MQVNNIGILRASNGDLEMIGQIELLSKLNQWGIESYKSELTKNDNLFFVAKSNEKVVGFVFTRLIIPEAEIFNIAVLPDFRKQGIGRNLFEIILKQATERGCQKFWLEVRESNFAARRFYEKLGFQNIGRRKNYYRFPVEDALLLEYKFAEEP